MWDTLTETQELSEEETADVMARGELVITKERLAALFGGAHDFLVHSQRSHTAAQPVE